MASRKCKYGKLKKPIKTKSGSKRRCKKKRKLNAYFIFANKHRKQVMKQLEAKGYSGRDLITKTAKIIDLVEDRIEIKTFPENETLYIDFGYSGIPKNIPIKSITIRPEPLIAKASSQDDLTEEEILEEAGDRIIKACKQVI